MLDDREDDDAGGPESLRRGAAEVPDQSLIAAAVLGDRDAFEAIVMRYGPDMYRFTRNLLSDSGAAEEVVQDAFVAAWKGLENFRGASSLRTWLFSLVTHKVVDHRRRRAIAPAEDWVFERPDHDPSGDPERQAASSGFMAALDAALSELPYRQRSAWLLREVEGMTHVEIGQIMTMSPGAVRGQLQRARTTLSARMSTWR
ncbi:RNA polymerase sigma factor [Rhodococcoides kyotonense]|uniref:RNA polymerase sigma-70 factor, ECF subfamily n=1 Tax=Rhodococcoides kyotonense TaxID=398843 RepID=A0A239MD76_9NOCA|nr:RNA polymerase sigma factor [Rhodococcus kyotonensis]SNT40977.1 RNA polymerase sigma-70 factor, ECF subfamily [Rhodococcus kyotonensis]